MPSAYLQCHSTVVRQAELLMLQYHQTEMHALSAGIAGWITNEQVLMIKATGRCACTA